MCAQSKSAEMLARENCATILRRQQATAGAYKCKSCDRAFGSFQALGGHRASHKKIRLAGYAAVAAPAAKEHECGQCRSRFPTGQALGGHMRKHAELNLKRKRGDDEGEIRIFPILRDAKMCKRVALQLDLNFPPPLDDDRSFLQLACFGY